MDQAASEQVSMKTARYGTLDTVRGFALLGILPMNMPIFALSAYIFFSPRNDGGFEGLDWLAWASSHLLFEMKMMALFSMLFGAGVVLFIERHNAKHGKGGVQAQFIRLGWLLVFGMVHAYAIWEGDILVAYALCGVLAVALHRLSVKWLLGLGALLLMGGVVMWGGLGVLFSLMRSGYENSPVVDGVIVPEPGTLADAWKESRSEFVPDAEALASERDAFLGSYSDLFWNHRLLAVLEMQTVGMLTFAFWRIAGLMCIGMALFKLRFWQGEWSGKGYARLSAVAGGIGLVLVCISIYRTSVLPADFVRLFLIDMWFNYFGSVGVALAMASGLIVLTRSGLLEGATDRLASVGRMAFTNYISQSVLCALTFYGYAGGLWGSLSRFDLLGLVVFIWCLQLVWSPMWLSRFRMGPLEWVWRSLCAWSFQPLVRERPSTD